MSLTQQQQSTIYLQELYREKDKYIIMADELGSEGKEKSIYLMQIQYLDELLKSRQLQCDELELQNQDLNSCCRALRTDGTDIGEYLKYAAVEAEEKLEELAERLEVQLQADRRDKEALKLQHSRQLRELRDRIDQQNQENMLAAKFEEQQELEEQLMQLTEQQTHMKSVKKQLVQQKQKIEHEFAIETLKEEAKTEWTTSQEMLSREAADTRKKVRVLVQQERAQHGELPEKIQVLLDQNHVLWRQKDELREKTERLPDVDHMRRELVELSLENVTCEMELEDLTKTSHQLKAELKVKLKDCSSAHERLLEEDEALRQLLTSATEEKHHKTSEASELRAELQRQRSSRRQLEANMQEAAVVLRRILTIRTLVLDQQRQDDRKQLVDSEKTSKTPGKMLRLLEILQSTAPQGPGSTPEESSGGQNPQTTDPQTDRTQTLNLATDPLYLMARYRPGDLGFVPRPTWEHKPASSRTGTDCFLPTGNSADRRDPALIQRPPPPQTDE
ncbi:cilia- and flagella-associated protein 157-like [Cebidichthys violaceus]|uniref:cilia- and flagella-associated protein 157-like n=1 Tax=Cebidichthys violaceus TaxID=271503 RepID=UPI0035CA0B83